MDPSLALPHRAVLSLDGPDTISLLERTVTHNVTGWISGEMRFGGLLTPQGKIIVDYLATRTETGVLIDVHEDAIDDLAKRLKLFRLRADVEIEPRGDLFATADPAGAPDPRSADLPKRSISADSPESTATTYHAGRIAAGVPEWGADYRASEVFPTDVNMDVMNGIDYRKGCFVGQEVASRMKRRGTIRRRTIAVSGKSLESGADILAPAPIGKVTSVAGEDGLASLRIDRLQSATEAPSCNGAPVSIASPDWLKAETISND